MNNKSQVSVSVGSFVSDWTFSPPSTISGYVYSKTKIENRLAVGLFHNGILVETRIADSFREDLNQRGINDGCYGFSFSVIPNRISKFDAIWISVLNHDHIIGDITFGNDDATRASAVPSPGTVRQYRGLILTGEVSDAVTDASSYRIVALHEDRIVGEARVDRWRHIGDPEDIHGVQLSYDLILASDLADGRPKIIRVETEYGDALRGSPLTMVAHPNSLFTKATAGMGDRVNRLDRHLLYNLIANSAPLSAYCELNPQILKPVTSNSEEIRHFGETGRIIKLEGQSAAFVYHRDMQVRSDISTLCPSDYFDIVYGDYCMMQSSLNTPNLSDTLDYDFSSKITPYLLSSFNYERLIEQGYCTFGFFIRLDLLNTVLTDGAKSPFEVFIQAIIALNYDTENILHLPQPVGVLVDLDTKTANGSMIETIERSKLPITIHSDTHPTSSNSTLPSIRIKRSISDHSVSVIIPTKDGLKLLKRTIETLEEFNDDINIEILVIDNGSTKPEAISYLDTLNSKGVKVLDYPYGFNFADMNNLAVQFAAHEQICFLNNDVEFFQKGVLDELLNRLADPQTAAVGPLMLRASDQIQHGGVVLGQHYGASHAFVDRIYGDTGAGDLLCVAHEVSAVTAAMMVTRKSIFSEIGGFDAVKFPINFNDVDYCLKARERGYRIVFTPHAVIRHFESVSRGPEHSSPSRPRMLRELELLREVWFDVIHNDPFYHPAYSLEAQPYAALAVEQRSNALR